MKTDPESRNTRWRHPYPLAELLALGDAVVGVGGGALSVFGAPQGELRTRRPSKIEAAVEALGAVYAVVFVEPGKYQIERLRLPSLAWDTVNAGPVVRMSTPAFAVRADAAEFVALNRDRRPSFAVFAMGESAPRVVLAKSWTARSRIGDRAAFSPDGTLLAVALHPQWYRGSSEKWPLTVWRAQDGTSFELKGHCAPVLEVRFGPDGTLYSADARGTVIAWDLASGKVRWRFCAGLRGGQEVDARPRVAVAPDGATVCAGIPCAGVFFLDAKDGRLRWSASQGGAALVLPVAIAPDGRRVFVGDGVGVRVRDARDGALVDGAEGPVGAVRELRVGARDGACVAVTSAPEQVWARGPEGAWRTEPSGGMLSASRDGTAVAVLASDDEGVVRDVRTGAVRARVPVPPRCKVACAALSGDGRRLAVVHAPTWNNPDKTVRLSVYAVDEGRTVARLAEGQEYASATTWLWDERGERLGVVCGEHLRLFDVRARTLVAELHGSARGLGALRVSDDGAWLYGLDGDVVMHRWSLADGALALRAVLPEDVVATGLLAARGDRVALRTAEGVCVWDCARAEVVAREAAPAGRSVSAAAWDDAGTLVLGCEDGTVHGLSEGPASTVATDDRATEGWEKDFVAAVAAGDLGRAKALAQGVPAGAVRARATVERVRDALVDLEVRAGVTDAHRALSERWLAPGGPWRWQDDGRAPGAWAVVGARGDGAYLALGTNSDLGDPGFGGLYVVDLETGRCVWTDRAVLWGLGQGRHSGDEGRLRWTPDGERLGSSWAQSGVGVWDVFRGMRAGMDITNGSDSGPAWCFTHDGREVVIGCAMTKGGDFERGSATPFAVLEIAGDTRTNPYRSLDEGKLPKGFPKDQTWWNWLHCTPDGQRLCAVHGASALVLDLPSGAVRFATQGPGGYHVERATFSVDGRWYFDGHGVLAAEPKAKAVPVGVASPVDSRWSPVEDLLAVASGDEVVLFLAGAGKVIARLECAVARARDALLGDSGALAFSADGRVLAVLTSAKTAVVWSFEDGGRVEVPVDEDVCGLALGPEARTLAGWSRDALWVWRLADAKLVQTLRLRDARGRYWRDDAAHPLEFPGGNAANLFARDPCFPVAVGDGRAWAGAFETGLVVCPPSARAQLDERLSAVLHDRVSWPLRWAEGSAAVAVVDTWEDAWGSPRWPAKIPASVRAWQDPATRPSPKETLGFRAPDGESFKDVRALATRERGRYGVAEVYTLSGAKDFRAKVKAFGGVPAEVFSDVEWEDHRWRTGVIARSDDGTWMVWDFHPGGGTSGLGIDLDKVRRVEVLEYLGHPDDELPETPKHTLRSLRGRTVFLGALGPRERRELAERLVPCGALVADVFEAGALYVVAPEYDRAKLRKLAEAVPAGAEAMPYWTCVELTGRAET